MAVAIRGETIVADTVRIGRQDVNQETSDERIGRQRQRLRAVLTVVVLPADTNAAVLDVDQAVVGDRDAVVVAAPVGGDAGQTIEAGLA